MMVLDKPDHFFFDGLLLDEDGISDPSDTLRRWNGDGKTHPSDFFVFTRLDVEEAIECGFPHHDRLIDMTIEGLERNLGATWKDNFLALANVDTRKIA
jgi:hypothetical protein